MDFCEYRGYQVEVTDRGQFQVIVDEQPNPIAAETLSELKTKMDQYLNRKAKTRTLALPVILHNGETAIVTGIHLRTGSVLGLPEHDTSVYPKVDWIMASLDRMRMLRREIDRLASQVYPYTINTSRHKDGGRSPLADVYAAAIDKLEAEYHEKKTAAEQAEHVEEAS